MYTFTYICIHISIHICICIHIYKCMCKIRFAYTHTTIHLPAYNPHIAALLFEMKMSNEIMFACKNCKPSVQTRIALLHCKPATLGGCQNKIYIYTYMHIYIHLRLFNLPELHAFGGIQYPSLLQEAQTHLKN